MVTFAIYLSSPDCFRLLNMADSVVDTVFMLTKRKESRWTDEIVAGSIGVWQVIVNAHRAI